jgi:hypothetical protein
MPGDGLVFNLGITLARLSRVPPWRLLLIASGVSGRSAAFPDRLGRLWPLCGLWL